MKAGAKLVVRPATLRDALALAPLVRPEDVEEWIALAPLHASPGLVHSLAYGVTHGEAWYAAEEGAAEEGAKDTGWKDAGAPVALYGLCDGGGVGVPWLLATPAVARHGGEAVRRGRERLRAWKDRGLPLANVVSARHTRAVRYIRACGYDLLRTFRAYGEDFFLFGSMPCVNRP